MLTRFSRFFLIFLILAPAVLLYLILTPVHVLEIAYTGTGRRIFRSEVQIGDRFSLGYTNSVQLCEVVDEFEIDGDHRMTLVSTIFPDHGAGLPSVENEKGIFSISDDGIFEISSMNRQISQIFLRVEKQYSNIFTFGSRRINLSEDCGDALLTVRIRKYNALRRLLWGVMDAG